MYTFDVTFPVFAFNNDGMFIQSLVVPYENINLSACTRAPL